MTIGAKDVDVAIIGGGIAGLIAARTLTSGEAGTVSGAILTGERAAAEVEAILLR